MKLQNTTKWSDVFLRRMISWCCRELDASARLIHIATFRQRRTRTYSGRAWVYERRIVVSININPNSYPCRGSYGAEGHMFHDAIEALVAVTTHECYHVAAVMEADHKQRTRRGRLGSSEALTIRAEKEVLEKFRAARTELLVEWSESPALKLAPVVLPVWEQRAQSQIQSLCDGLSTQSITDEKKINRRAEKAHKASLMLEKWEAKMKLAAGKVKKYRRKVAYYNRVTAQAACRTKV